MAICTIACSDELLQRIQDFPKFHGADFVEMQFPISGSDVQIDLLITDPSIRNLSRLAATISDWNVPPVALFILPEESYESEQQYLSHHPRVGRSIFFCKDTTESITQGLETIHAFEQTRSALPIDNSTSGNYNINNISPRWLFQTMMEHLDEYIYFKDRDSKFLAVSRYLAESCGKQAPTDVIGLTDFDLFDEAHSKEAFNDEQKIVSEKIDDLYKEEAVSKNGKMTWVASRKLPLHTRSNFMAGSFGLSRDITEEKELHQKLEENHARMQAELLLARNLQSTLMQQGVPDFASSKTHSSLEVATKYIPSFHLSGDFFSIVKTAEGGAAILLADVMGHGVRAAMVTAMIQIAVHQLQDVANQPAAFMTRLNDMMQRTMQPSGETMFATAVYCYIDLETQQLTYVQAGARHGIHVPSGNSRTASVFNGVPTGPALGLIPGMSYHEAHTTLESGDEVLLYTDGIVEAATGDEEEYSEARLTEFLMTHRRNSLTEMVDALLESVQSFTHSKDLDDDVCLIALRIPEA